MSASELIEWLEAAGARLVYANGSLTLRTRAGSPQPDAEVVAALAEFGDAVTEHFEARVSHDCEECGRGVHTADPEVVYSACGNVYCPSWKPGVGPAWLPRARSYGLYLRSQKAAEAKRLEEGIPE